MGRPITTLKVPQGLRFFDLEPGDAGAIHLRHFANRVKESTDKSNRIQAYWLPWHSTQAATIQLGREADYFFTSALGGCRMQVGAGENPLVMHIAGNMSHAQREASAAAGMGAGYAASRRFSSSTEYASTELAFFVGKAYTTGVIRKTRRWRFFAQRVRRDDAGNLVVGSLLPHENGVMEI